MSLRVGDKAAFKCYDGKIIVGEVVSIANQTYFVISATICTMYADGLFRFQERNIVRG